MTGPSTAELIEQALALHRRGAIAEAAARYTEALGTEPGNAEANYGLALISCQHGRFEEGAERARRALAADPRHARALVILGRALSALGQHVDALAQFERAIALDPGLAQAHANRADILSEVGRTAAAIESYDHAVALTPDSFPDWINRGVALIAVGRYHDALVSFDRAMALNPGFDQAHVLAAPRLLSRLRICDWDDLDAGVAEILAMVRAGKPLSVPFAIVAIPSSPAEQLQCARRYIEEQPAFVPLWRGEIYAHQRIRVAYLSADFREHATAYLAAGLFEQHDRSRFEITALSLGPNDRSPMRRRLENAIEHFVDVSDRNDADIAALMRQYEIDIAVDLMAFTKDNRLNVLAHRAAPIQVNYLGYPGTMGAPYIDYILADGVVIPEDESRFYSENVVRLPFSYQINDDRREIASRIPTRRDCRLPEDAFVFCCFNHTQKILPAIFDIWMRLLRVVDHSVLWLIESEPAAMANLRREAKKRGVAPERLVFAPKASLPDHLARHRLADLFLDTLPYNAHTTASDALWSGLPVLTCPGPTFAGRVAASLLNAIGLNELITPTLEEYEAMAVALARDPAALAAIRAKLARNRNTFPLFDTVHTTRHIESAFATMMDIFRQGGRPQGFSVDPT